MSDEAESGKSKSGRKRIVMWGDFCILKRFCFAMFLAAPSGWAWKGVHRGDDDRISLNFWYDGLFTWVSGKKADKSPTLIYRPVGPVWTHRHPSSGTDAVLPVNKCVLGTAVIVIINLNFAVVCYCMAHHSKSTEQLIEQERWNIGWPK